MLPENDRECDNCLNAEPIFNIKGEQIDGLFCNECNIVVDHDDYVKFYKECVNYDGSDSCTI